MVLTQKVVLALTLLIVLLGQSFSVASMPMSNCTHMSNNSHSAHSLASAEHNTPNRIESPGNQQQSSMSHAMMNSDNTEMMDCCDAKCECPQNSCHNASYLLNSLRIIKRLHSTYRVDALLSNTAIAHIKGLYRPPMTA